MLEKKKTVIFLGYLQAMWNIYQPAFVKENERHGLEGFYSHVQVDSPVLIVPAIRNRIRCYTQDKMTLKDYLYNISKTQRNKSTLE